MNVSMWERFNAVNQRIEAAFDVTEGETERSRFELARERVANRLRRDLRMAEKLQFERFCRYRSEKESE